MLKERNAIKLSCHVTIVVVWLLSHVWLFTTPWTAAYQAYLSLTISRSLLKLMSIDSVMPSNISFSVNPFSGARSFPASGSFPMSHLFASSGQILELQIQHHSFQWTLGVISFRIDLFDFLAVQGTLKSLIQHHNSKASIPQRSTFFMVQLSHLYMTTGKTTALTRQIFVGKVMSLPFNMLSRFVIAFLPKSKHLLLLWLLSLSAVILDSKKIKSVTVCTFLHLFAMKWWNWMPWS